MTNALSLGDLAQSFTLRRQGIALRTEMDRLNKELVTGQVGDVKAVLAGNVSFLSEIENDLRLLEGFRIVGAEAAQFADAMQLSLGRIQDSTLSFSQDMLSVAKNAVKPVLEQYAVDARAELETVVNALNTKLAGRSVFSGTSTDQPAIADVQTILDEVALAVAGSTSVDDIFAAADAWFDDPAGFSALLYGGSTDPLVPFRVADGETVSMPYTAEHESIKDVIKGISLAALGNTSLIGTADGLRDFMHRAGERILESQAGLTAVRADVGSSQERIERLSARNAAERLSVDFAKTELLAADPYEAATKLEEVQFQLQSLYTVTARMSQLSLANFLR